jgi:hypothetical protein
VFKQYKIHPAIGIARIGNSAAAWFDGPEVPDLDFTPPPNGEYRDQTPERRIRRQAVRFRIYEYTYEDAFGTRLRSVRQLRPSDVAVQWHVNLANIKSFRQDPGVSNHHIPEPNDPGVKTVAGANQKQDVQGQVFGQNVQLGTLLTDPEGVLHILGGFGRSASPAGSPIQGLYPGSGNDPVAHQGGRNAPG